MLKETAGRWLVCLLSIILLMVLGAIGEEILNLPPVRNIKHQESRQEIELNPPSSFVFENYGLNNGDFGSPLTPFMLVFFGLAAFGRSATKGQGLFWYLFASIWLLVLIYCGMFALALMMPYHILLIEIPASPVGSVVAIIDYIILATIAALLVQRFIRWFFRRRPEKAGGGKETQ
jgi:hypothetical protein